MHIDDPYNPKTWDKIIQRIKNRKKKNDYNEINSVLLRILEEDSKRNTKNAPIKIDEVMAWLIGSDDKNIPKPINDILNHLCLDIKCETCKVRQILSKSKDELDKYRTTGTIPGGGMLETLTNELNKQDKQE